MPWSRIFSGIVAIALALGMIIIGGWYFTLGFCVIVYLGLLEYFQLVRAKGIAPAAKITIVVSLRLLVTSTISPTLTDAVFPLAGTFICFYLLFQPKMATIADEASLLPSPATAASTSNLPLNGYWPNSWDLNVLPPSLTATFLAFGCIWAA